MVFLDVKSSSIYMTIDANQRVFRPLVPKPLSKWVRNIPACSVFDPVTNTKKDLRKFRTVDADFSNWLRDNPDPLWDKLQPRDQFNRNNQRQDFSARPTHIIVVWSYADNDVKVVKQGNEFYEEMGKFFDANEDIQTCDWVCWSVKATRVEYKTSRRDKSQFICPVDINTVKPKIQAMIEQALRDLRPWKTEEEMIRYLRGEASQTPQSVTSFPVAAQQPMLQAPQQSAPYQVNVQPNFGQPVQVPTVWTPNQQPAPQPSFTVQNPGLVTPPNTAGNPGGNMVFTSQVAASQVPQQMVQPMPQATLNVGMPQGFTPQPMPQAFVPQAFVPAPTQPAPDEVQNAPVSSKPVFAPPVHTEQTAGLGGTTLNFGKHAGKTLVWIRDNDPSYLSFLRGNKKELKDAIDAVMGSQPAQQQTMTPAQPQMGQPQVAQPSPDDMRRNLVRECNERLMTVPEFQNAGIATHMMPFLNTVVGTTDFSNAPLDKLQALKFALDAKLGAAQQA